MQSIAASLAQPLLEQGQSSLALWTHTDFFSPVHRDFASVNLTCSYFSPPVAPSFPGDDLQNLARRGGVVGKEKEVEPKHQKQQPQQKAEL